LKVLHVAPSLARSYGGPTQSLVGFCRAAADAGAEVEVAGPRASDEDARWLAGELPGVAVRAFPAFGRGAFTASPALQAWLGRHGGGAGVVHVHGLWNPVSSLAARLCIRRGVPVVIRPFGTLSRYSFTHRRTLLKRAYRRLLDGPNLRAAAGVHFTTEAERDEAAWHGIDFAGRAWVVPPPLADVPDPLPRRDGGPPTLVCVCRLNPVKNLELLLDAWALAAPRLGSARLVIAGDGDPAYVRALKARAGAGPGRVDFPGFVGGAEKRALLAGARAFALPSHHESFGVAVLEAIAAGLPVAVTPEVQLAPFIARNALGEVVEASVEAWAGAIERLLTAPPLDRARGARLVRQTYSAAAVGGRLLEMYDAAALGAPLHP
jgi:glycosyltransferase involved in cell wall biosynthesis